MNYLFIAEKKSVMDSVLETYKKHKADIISMVGKIDFIAVSGHICRYLEPDEYPQWKGLKWQEADLPMIPNPFIVSTIEDKQKKEIFLKIKNAIETTPYDGIIVATDSDVEGNGIYYLVCEKLKLKHYRTLRFFEQSMTDKEILYSLYHMTDFYRNPRDVRMTEAYLVRSHADWLIGMNATRALSIKTGETLRVGRVKAPALKLVYDNSKAIDEFVPHSDYLAKAIYFEEFNGIYHDADGPVLFSARQEAESFIQSLNHAGSAPITHIEKVTVKTRPPKLYKLSTIQKEAGALYNYDLQHTLDIIQRLYENKLVSYPRTNGEYVSSQKARSFPDLLASAGCISSLSPFVNRLTQADITKTMKDTRVVNDKEVQKESHDALLPTEKKPDISKLSQEETYIYEMICKRLLAQFFPDLVEEKTVLLADIDGYTFRSTGTAIVDKGWATLYNRQGKGEVIPNCISEGETLSIEEMEAYEKKSTPPKRLTDATLGDAMENIAKYITDQALKQTMRDAKGIGQPSTRGTIINDLIKSGYMERRGKTNQLFITDKGKLYIESMIRFTIIDPVQAARWESIFQDVREGSVSYPDAEGKFQNFVHDFVKEVDALQIQNNGNNFHTYSKHGCPFCGKEIISFNWGYACEDNRSNGCSFKVSSFGGKFKKSDLDALLSIGKTRTIKGITKSNSGKSIDAQIKLNLPGSQYATGFEFPSKTGASSSAGPSRMTCPYCGKQVRTFDWGYACEDSRSKGCSFKVSSLDGKLTEKELQKLIQTGKTNMIRGIAVSSKKGTKFDARLALNPKGEAYATKFEF